MDKVIHVVAALIEKEGKILAAKRADINDDLAAWEFPGGKVKEGESNEAALVREIKEELDADITNLWHLDTKTKSLDESTRLSIDYYVATLKDKSVPSAKAGIHDEIRWIDAVGLLDLDWSYPDSELAMALGQAWEEIFSTARL